jgi:hypothetical protein
MMTAPAGGNQEGAAEETVTRSAGAPLPAQRAAEVPRFQLR